MIVVSEEKSEYYKRVQTESINTLSDAIPRIALDVAAAVLIWLFGRLVFIPIAQGINFFGYPFPKILNFIILVALAVIVLRMLIDVRKAMDGVAGYAAVNIGAPYDVSIDEVEHYKIALRGLFYIIIVSLAYLLFVDYLSNIHPALSGIILLAIVIWAIYQIWRVVQAVSSEIRRYTSEWARKLRPEE